MTNHRYISTVLRGSRLTAYLRARLLGRRWSVLLQCPGGCPALRLVAGAKVNANKLWAISLGHTNERGYLQTELRDDVPGLEHFWLLDAQGAVAACSLGAPALPKNALRQLSLKVSAASQAANQPGHLLSSAAFADDAAASNASAARQCQAVPSATLSPARSENKVDNASNSTRCSPASCGAPQQQTFSDAAISSRASAAQNSKAALSESARDSSPRPQVDLSNHACARGPLATSSSGFKRPETAALHAGASTPPNPRLSVPALLKSPFFKAPFPSGTAAPLASSMDLLRDQSLIQKSGHALPRPGSGLSAFGSPARETSEVRFAEGCLPFGMPGIERGEPLPEKETPKRSAQPGVQPDIQQGFQPSAQPRYVAHCLLGKDAGYTPSPDSFFSAAKKDRWPARAPFQAGAE